MATVDIEDPVRADARTLQDLVDALGGIPLSRILAKPTRCEANKPATKKP